MKVDLTKATPRRGLLKRNVPIYDGDYLRGAPFKGEWVAVPSADFLAAVNAFDGAQDALRDRTEVACKGECDRQNDWHSVGCQKAREVLQLTETDND